MKSHLSFFLILLSFTFGGCNMCSHANDGVVEREDVKAAIASGTFKIIDDKIGGGDLAKSAQHQER